jgi:DNA replication protein DnaD
LSYVEGILKRWKVEGKQTKQEAKAARRKAVPTDLSDAAPPPEFS